jgi:hypothetical protein
MEATFSSETSINFQRITPRYILEDRAVYNYNRENLKSYIVEDLQTSETN